MTDQELEEAHAERPGARFEVKTDDAGPIARPFEVDLYCRWDALEQRLNKLAWFAVGGFLVVFVVLVAMGAS